MSLHRDIDEFCTFIIYKNGKYTISYDIKQEGNIYKLLKELGYGFVRTNKRRIYFKKSNSKFEVIYKINFKDAFRDFLDKNDFINIPANFTKNDILNWYFKKMPIKFNGLFNHYLEWKLSDDEINELLNYKRIC